MSIDKDDKGRRVEAEVEIQASPEAVWKAIATGPGIKSWFMGMEPEFDERVGGEVRTKTGDVVVETAKLTAWDPPRHFATMGDNAFGPGSPSIGYEWTVEAQGGGKCVMRMVQTLFTEDDSWDTQVGDTEAGWPAFFHILRNYVERHAGEPSGVVQAMGPVPGSKEEAFERLTGALGIGEIAKGASVDCDVDGVPAFSGEIEDVVRGRSDRIMIRLERPFAGTGWIGVGPIGGRMTAIVTLYYYGEGAAEASARDNAQLTGWLQAHGETVSSWSEVETLAPPAALFECLEVVVPFLAGVGWIGFASPKSRISRVRREARVGIGGRSWARRPPPGTLGPGRITQPLGDRIEMTPRASHDERIAKMTFASVYPHYVAKVEKKGRTEQELEKVITWLTGFTKAQIRKHIANKSTFEAFFDAAKLNPKAESIRGVICGYRVEEIENPLTRKARYLDKLVDELARGKKMESILRS